MFAKRELSLIIFALLGNIFVGLTQTSLQYELSAPRFTPTPVSVGPYALFCGGYWSNETSFTNYLSSIDIFNYQTRNWTTAELPSARYGALAAATGNYVLFVGGYNGSSNMPTSVVDIWNIETNEWTQKELSLLRSGISAVSTGRYALFAGGWNETTNYTSRVDIFNSTNQQWTIAELSEARNGLFVTTVGPYALIACGSNGVNFSSVVDLFHRDTLQMTSISFPFPRPQMAVISVGPLAMFAGGLNRSAGLMPLDRVDIWNHQTNEWTIDKLSYSKILPSAASSGKFAFFGPGLRNNVFGMDIYNYQTKEWITADLSLSRFRPAAVSAGPFVLFAGGTRNDTRITTSRVDIFQTCNKSSDCLDDGLFCTDSVCINGLCDFSLDHCRNNGECNNVCNEKAKNCLTALGSTCGESWCAGKLCDGAGSCSYSKPRCAYDNSTSTSCQLCNSERESCFRMEGEDCLITGAIAGKCDDLGHCTERIIPPEKKSSKTGLIVGVVIGVVAFLCLVAAIVCLLQRRNRKRNEDNNSPIELTSTMSGIVIDYKLGGGNFGEVYKGTWNGTTAVALKKLKDQTQLKEFEQEATMLQSLQHPNIVRYLGVHKASDGILYIVTEYISDGSLLSVIHEHMKEFDNSNLTSFAAQAASGMAYLGSKGIIHRDLSLRNLLASKRDSNQQKYQVYVSDFGLSRVAEGGYYRSSDNHIPVKWSAPEAIEYGFFTTKSDIWSFGVLLWELFSGGKQPYPGISNSEVLDKLNTGYRLPQPAGCPDEVYKLMQDCWKKNPDERPTFQEAFSILSNREQEIPVPTPLAKTDVDNGTYMNMKQ